MRADFAMVLHFHQPIGNFDSVISAATNSCYLPFLSMLEKFPEVKMSLHFSGCLLEWFEKKRPEIPDVIKRLAHTGQIEIIGGAFYEPILPTIPREDSVRQIKMMTKYLTRKFSRKPAGAWIPERVWEAFLPSVLSSAGVKYVVLDDTHFLYAGILKDRTYGFYTTSDNTESVAVFASDKMLRYSIPFKMPSVSIKYMEEVASGHSSPPLFVYADDGEKFGEWPGTSKWVFDEGWLENFFTELKNNEHWLNTVTLSESRKKRVSLGRVYLPSSSYEEMCKWALPARAEKMMEEVVADIEQSGKKEFYKPFIRGGAFRNFFVKYPESNQMHKKMLEVSRKLKMSKLAFGKNKLKKKYLMEAEKNLFQAQCNCAYWHGVFGGLYLYHLRGAVYKHLIESEVLMEKAAGRRQFLSVARFDMNADGTETIVLENKKITLYFSPAEGGALKEFDSKEARWNLINSLARREETYHKKITEGNKLDHSEGETKNETIHKGARQIPRGAKHYLYYDKHRRYSFIDHFLRRDVDVDEFQNSQYEEAGDFVLGEYDSKIKELKGCIKLAMTRTARAGEGKISLFKDIRFTKNGAGFTAEYKIKNTGGKYIDLIFSPEFNVTMPYADSSCHSLKINAAQKRFFLTERIKHSSAGKIIIASSEKGLSYKMDFDKKCPVWIFPIRTVSQSEKAYELNYQSTVILPRVSLKLAPGKEKRFTIKITAPYCLPKQMKKSD